MDENESTRETAEELAEIPAEAAEWGLEDTPDGAPEAPPPEPETFRLKHLGDEYEVTREEVIALAQKGRDYGRIRDRLDGLESRAGASPGIMREIHDFISEYGSRIDPATIPGEVWTEVRAGKPLLSAYQSYENRELRERLRGGVNRARAPGGTSSAGESPASGELESDWYAE